MKQIFQTFVENRKNLPVYSEKSDKEKPIFWSESNSAYLGLCRGGGMGGESEGIKTGEMSDFRPNTDWTGEDWGLVSTFIFIIYSVSGLFLSLH